MANSIRDHELLTKQKSYTISNIFQCTRQYCKLYFDNFSKLREHHLKFHGYDEDSVQMISCCICKANFDSQTKLEIHRQRHADIYSGVAFASAIKCPHCPIRLPNKTSLNLHIRSLHGGKFLPPTNFHPTVQNSSTPKARNPVIVARRVIPLVVRRTPVEGAVHASDILKTSLSAASSRSETNSQSAESLMSPLPPLNSAPKKLDNTRVVTISTGTFGSDLKSQLHRIVQDNRLPPRKIIHSNAPGSVTGVSVRSNSKSSTGRPGPRVFNTSLKAYACERCGETFKNRCALTYHEMKHKQKEKDFPCPVKKCYCAFNTQKKLRGHICRSHPELSDTGTDTAMETITKTISEAAGIRPDSLMGSCPTGNDSTIDSSFDMEEEEEEEEDSPRTSESTTEILIRPGANSSSYVQKTAAFFIKSESCDRDDEGAGGLMIDECVDDWAIAEEDEDEEDTADDDLPAHVRCSTKPSSSEPAATHPTANDEFEQLDRALTCQ